MHQHALGGLTIAEEANGGRVIIAAAMIVLMTFLSYIDLGTDIWAGQYLLSTPQANYAHGSRPPWPPCPCCVRPRLAELSVHVGSRCTSRDKLDTRRASPNNAGGGKTSEGGAVVTDAKATLYGLRRPVLRELPRALCMRSVAPPRTHPHAASERRHIRHRASGSRSSRTRSGGGGGATRHPQ
jgi:hypothetical protein